MIVVDSSALVAILEHEADAAIYAEALVKADRLLISAVNVHETGMVLRARRGEAARRARIEVGTANFFDGVKALHYSLALPTLSSSFKINHSRLSMS